jgi:hypothetical protein
VGELLDATRCSGTSYDVIGLIFLPLRSQMFPPFLFQISMVIGDKELEQELCSKRMDSLARTPLENSHLHSRRQLGDNTRFVDSSQFIDVNTWHVAVMNHRKLCDEFDT